MERPVDCKFSDGRFGHSGFFMLMQARSDDAHPRRFRRGCGRGAGVCISQMPQRKAPLDIDHEMYKWRHLMENFLGKRGAQRSRNSGASPCAPARQTTASRAGSASLPLPTIYDEWEHAPGGGNSRSSDGRKQRNCGQKICGFGGKEAPIAAILRIVLLSFRRHSQCNAQAGLRRSRGRDSDRAAPSADPLR